MRLGPLSAWNYPVAFNFGGKEKLKDLIRDMNERMHSAPNGDKQVDHSLILHGMVR